MFLGVPGRHQDVVQVNERERNITQNGVHQTLKGLSGILQTKRHPNEFKKAERCDYSRFCQIHFRHWYLVVSTDQINHRKYPGATEPTAKVLDIW